MARARVSEAFAAAVQEAMGPLNASQTSIKTGISYEYIRRMKAGHVPSEDIIKDFATAMDADVDALLIAAGYILQVPTDVLDALDYIRKHQRANGALNVDEWKEVEEAERRIREKRRRGHGSAVE